VPGSSPLDAVPIWGVFTLAVLIILVAADSGFRVGEYRRARSEDEKEAPVGAMVGSTLGLLAFILAFTFSLAATRFDMRRSLLLDEANAVGTTYLRAATLPERGPEIRALLREYVDVRVAAAQQRVEFTEARRRSEELQNRMWADAAALGKAQQGSIVVGLFIQSLNEVIDLHAMRLTALRNRIPTVIWIALTFLAVIAFTSMGYHAGLSRAGRSPAAIAVTLCFAIVITLIIDLDRPYEGFLTTSQQALIDARQGMTEP
jgi:hypothetical protein